MDFIHYIVNKNYIDDFDEDPLDTNTINSYEIETEQWQSISFHKNTNTQNNDKLSISEDILENNQMCEHGKSLCLLESIPETEENNELREDQDDNLYHSIKSELELALCENSPIKDIIPQLLESLVSYQPPLFYVLQNGDLNQFEYILSNYPHFITHLNNQSDSIFHLCIEYERSDILILILSALEKSQLKNEIEIIVNQENNLGMTPLHLVTSSVCLEILERCGADVSKRDSKGRSPLFIACALNRFECAEYLVNSLDEKNVDLLIPDNRGDTPLHAAACNGSKECLLVLLQQGIDPSGPNEKGLRAIELAKRNKHKECQMILQEYQLHYFTDSQFDSMLFLATITGHKMIKKDLKTLKPDVMSNSFIRHSSAKNLKATNSFFSLRSDKTMRMQKFGNSWICYEDTSSIALNSPNKPRFYWYNLEIGVGQWEIPNELQHYFKPTDFNISSSDVKIEKLPMKMKRFNNWIQYTVENNSDPFYFNESTGEFQWITPNEVALALEQQKPNVSKSGIVASSINCASHQTIGNWTSYIDMDSGMQFWYNHSTKQSQWEIPSEINHELLKEFPIEENEESLVTIHDSEELGI